MNRTFKSEEIIQAKEFINFINSAKNYCNFIESHSSEKNIEFLQITRQKLLPLYSAALELQWVNLQTNIDYDIRLDNNEFQNVLISISNRLSNLRYYWHVFDPTNNKETEPVCGDLVDDLGDIYKDLKYSILTFDLNKKDCVEIALWQFKFDFDKHWDNHCINALSAIHFFLQNE